MSRFKRVASGDDGVSLVLALVFIVVVGTFSVAALQKSQAVTVSGGTLQQRGQLQYALDGGVDKALQTLRSELTSGTPSSCVDPTASAGTGSLALNGNTANYTCKTLAGRAATTGDASITNYALVVTSPNPGALTTQSGVSQDLNVAGSVYLNGKVVDGNIGKPIEITDGDLTAPLSRAGCQADLDALANITMTGTGQLRSCTEQTLAQALPTVSLPPTAPSVDLSPVLGNGVKFTQGPKTCTVYYPGLYTSPPVLSGNSKNYFVSGLYYFRNVGSWTIDDANIEVTGGQRSLATDTAVPSNDCSAMNMDDSKALASPVVSSMLSTITPYKFSYGTTWVFGGNSTIFVKKGAISLFSPPAGGSTVPVSLVGASSYTASSYLAQPLGTATLTGGGNSSSMEVNGKVFAPNSYVEVFSTNNTIAAAKGGVVGYQVQLKASAAGSDALVISASGSAGNPPPPFRTVLVETTDASGVSNGKNAAVATISNFSPFTVKVLSWRSE